METVKRSLFSIEDEYIRLMDELEENEGELTEEQDELLIKNLDDFEHKIGSYCGIIQEKIGKSSVLKDEIKRLQAYDKAVRTATEKLKSIVLSGLELYGIVDKKGISRYETDLFRLSTRKSNSVVIAGEDELKDGLIANLHNAAILGNVDEQIKEIDAGKLFINYNPPVDDETEDNDDTVMFNAVEVDFLNTVPTYGISLDVTYQNMLKVADAINSIVGDNQSNVEYSVNIPKKETSEVIKSNSGFRIAGMVEKRSLVIK